MKDYRGQAEPRLNWQDFRARLARIPALTGKISGTRWQEFRHLLARKPALEIQRESGEPFSVRTRPYPYPFNPDEASTAMKSRAELLAEIEEKRLQDNRLTEEVNVLSVEEPDVASGYNPYDYPGRSKEIPEGADITLRRRAVMRRKRRR